MDSLDMIIFVVSAADRESFDRLPILIEEKRAHSSPSRLFTSLVFITKSAVIIVVFLYRLMNFIIHSFSDSINLPS